MAYWTDDRVKSRAVMEKKSKTGLLARLSRSQPSDTTSASFDPHTMLTHPEVRTTYFRLVSMLGQEMLALQDRLTESPNLKSMLWKKNVLKSPWIDPNRKTKGKRQYDEKEQLYELCTTKSIPKDEAEEEFVDMNGWHLQREELLCLRPRTWINNTVMTMIAKTLVADQLDNGGTVTRHIFSPHFMEKMIEDPMTWPLEANKAEILPDRIGYNIGDCRFIFGPSLRWDHWFCYVLDTTTMTFYALDSENASWTYSGW
ncbi:hypothetical protein K1719_041080 [Acacia pycnantha]|nr:hypothetical protein K1719_041080 [Acacia pycnantha]